MICCFASVAHARGGGGRGRGGTGQQASMLSGFSSGFHFLPWLKGLSSSRLMHCFNFSVNSLLSEASTVHQLWAELAEKTQPGPWPQESLA